MHQNYDIVPTSPELPPLPPRKGNWQTAMSSINQAVEDNDLVSTSAVTHSRVDGWEDEQEPQDGPSQESQRECYMCQQTIVISRKRDWQYVP